MTNIGDNTLRVCMFDKNAQYRRDSILPLISLLTNNLEVITMRVS